ncbi:hypothetical protein FB567DRAFT_528343 [Paraphoma chrysanthemicola]|uniref:Uncharacterized protein n=1 Tax=Paraphoma chrysanthemicola TaxID=798071 RepID=A0A8K0R408_9PLEO|nr:hypothetical protein FB567DRAFT_528343 [Paraphoma chrysanthemicola]
MTSRVLDVGTFNLHLTVMESLPVELISYVAEQLEQYEVVRQCSPYFTSMEDATSTADCAGWLVHNAISRRDLSNFRFTCRTMYNGSLPAFGRILGSRVFRKSRIGLKDLEDISSCVDLRPHVRTLTFGTAEFNDPTYNTIYQDIFRTIPEPDRSKLMDAYDIEYSWEFLNNYHEEHSTYREDLSAALRKFPNLGEVRLSENDYPRALGHLGQWLGPGDKETLDRALESWGRARGQLLYRCGNYDSLRSIAEALRDATTTIRVLRLGRNTDIERVAFDPSDVTDVFFSTLRKLSMDIDPESLCDTKWAQSRNPFSFFTRLSHITELSISMGCPERYSDVVDHTSVFHTLLRPLNRLTTLAIYGSWYFPQAELAALVSNFSTSLTNFTLIGPMIPRGSLVTALQSILALSMPHMRHLELSDMVEGDPVGNYTRKLSKRFKPAFDDANWQDLINEIRPGVEQYASYDVILSSGKNEYTFSPRSAVIL